MISKVRLTEDEIKEAIVFYLEQGPAKKIVFYLEQGPAKKEVKKSSFVGNEGKPCIYLAQGGVANSPDPREHTYIYAECEVEII